MSHSAAQATAANDEAHLARESDFSKNLRLSKAQSRLRTAWAALVAALAVMLLAGCAQYGGLLPDSGKTGQRIEAALEKLDRQFLNVEATSSESGFHRYYKVRVSLAPEERMSVEVLAEVVLAAAGAVKSSSVYGLDFTFFQHPSDGPGGGFIDLEEYAQGFVGHREDLDRWFLAGAENRSFIISMEAARELLRD